METVTIEIPVSAGKEVFKTNDRCEIITGVIEKVCINAESYIQDTSAYTKEVSPVKDNITMRIVVQWKGYRDTTTYYLDDIDKYFFLSKESLIKYLVNTL